MEFSMFFIFTLLVISSDAIPIDEGAEDTTVTPDVMDNVEVEDISPEEADIDKEMVELREKECFVLLGDCWMMYKERKPYVSEETRLKVCLKNIKGFLICESIDDAQAVTAREEAEERKKVDEENQAELIQKALERKEKLEQRKVQLATLRMELSELVEEQRLEKENSKSTTIPTDTVADESIEQLENEIETETATIGAS